MQINHKEPQFWGEKRYYSLDYYLKQTFGEKVYRLSLNGGMTCPNRDGLLDDKDVSFAVPAEAAIFLLLLSFLSPDRLHRQSF